MASFHSKALEHLTLTLRRKFFPHMKKIHSHLLYLLKFKKRKKKQVTNHFPFSFNMRLTVDEPCKTIIIIKKIAENGFAKIGSVFCCCFHLKATTLIRAGREQNSSRSTVALIIKKGFTSWEPHQSRRASGLSRYLAASFNPDDAIFCFCFFFIIIIIVMTHPLRCSNSCDPHKNKTCSIFTYYYPLRVKP